MFVTCFTANQKCHVTAGGNIQHHTGHLPAVIALPALSVTVPGDADPRETARLLRLLADEIDGARL